MKVARPLPLEVLVVASASAEVVVVGVDVGVGVAALVAHCLLRLPKSKGLTLEKRRLGQLHPRPVARYQGCRDLPALPLPGRAFSSWLAGQTRPSRFFLARKKLPLTALG